MTGCIGAWKISFTFHFDKSFILDDVKLAEISNNSFEWTNVTFYGAKTYSDPPTYFQGVKTPWLPGSTLLMHIALHCWPGLCRTISRFITAILLLDLDLDLTLQVMSLLSFGYNCDSTSIGRTFDCLWKVIKCTAQWRNTCCYTAVMMTCLYSSPVCRRTVVAPSNGSRMLVVPSALTSVVYCLPPSEWRTDERKIITTTKDSVCALYAIASCAKAIKSMADWR